MTIDSFFSKLYSSNLDGKEIDQGLLVILGNLLKDKPVFSLPLKDTRHLSRMIHESSKSFTFLDGGIFYWCAYFDYNEFFPIGRLYNISEKNMLKWAEIDEKLISLGHRLQLIKHDEFSKIIGEVGAFERIATYKKTKQRENAPYEGLLNGRIESTSVSQGLYIKTGKCLICNANADKLVNSTIGDKDNGIMIGFNLCNAHYEESLKYDCLMNFYCNSFNSQKWFKTRSLSTDELVLHSMLILEKELECTIDKVLDNTITAFRKVSGFKIILRLDAINDYGYMIFNDKGKQLARFDSADHYDINYGPDHLHFDLKKKEEVISSFLSGIPEFDYKSILKVIQEYENKKPYSTIPSHK